MAGNQGSALSLDQMLQESRQKRKAENLAQQIFGKKNRSRTPAGPRAQNQGGGGSLASRVGVAKRPSSLPRSNTAPARNARPAPPQVTRPTLNDNHRARSTLNQPSSDPVSDAKSNGYSRNDAPQEQNGSTGISFRGAANSGPHIVVAQNFATGTSAADIESVMADVGGSVIECHLVASTPTVIAEITFSEKAGAETVINTFNGKKADGRTLNVYLKAGGVAKLNTFQEDVPPPSEEVMMDVDENAQSREAEDRLREERRRAPQDNFPTGPKVARHRSYGLEDDRYRGPGRAEPAYQDGRYGFNGGYNGGRMRDSDRLYYSDRGGRRGQSWRP